MRFKDLCMQIFKINRLLYTLDQVALLTSCRWWYLICGYEFTSRSSLKTPHEPMKIMFFEDRSNLDDC